MDGTMLLLPPRLCLLILSRTQFVKITFRDQTHRFQALLEFETLIGVDSWYLSSSEYLSIMGEVLGQRFSSCHDSNTATAQAACA
jgi:hypothetical protein